MPLRQSCTLNRVSGMLSPNIMRNWASVMGECVPSAGMMSTSALGTEQLVEQAGEFAGIGVEPGMVGRQDQDLA